MDEKDKVKILDGVQITCKTKGNYYNYIIIKEDGSNYSLGTSDKEPERLTIKSNIGSDIYNYLKTKNYNFSMNITKEEQQNTLKEDFSTIIMNLQEIIDNKKEESKNEESNYQEYLNDKYLKLNSYFELQCEENDYTPLQFLAQVTQGLGVGLSVEVIKAFFGYFQTYLGLKGTNVIAIGHQSSGKSHILETALGMIPDENVHRGVKSAAHFYRTFNGQNLTGHIFYLGDLGGDNDNQNTIELRDILKQLTSDGYVERGIVDDKTPHDEFVSGFPCLTYTTANEDMINLQERSRSIIITPPDAEAERIETFNFISENPGQYKKLIDKIKDDKESIKGLVYEARKSIPHVECFNPYMYNITDFLGDINDFNRKIKEFNAILKLVCLLNNPLTFTHDLYLDAEYESVETMLIIARKQDILNALYLFDNTNDLLPTDVALANGLIKEFKPFELDTLDDYKVSDFEDNVKREMIYKANGDVDWENLVDLKDNPGDYFFTLAFLRKAFPNQKWYRNTRDNLSKKLNKLYQSGILIKVGKSENLNVYGINRGLGDKINNIQPKFGEEPLQKALSLFETNYPSLYANSYESILLDSKIHLKKIDFEVVGSKLYHVPW